MSKEDNLDHVKEILNEWCEVLGAKFNTEKTKIVPIGLQEHRARMVETRKLNQDERAPLDEKIKIARDKEAIRLLGAWIQLLKKLSQCLAILESLTWDKSNKLDNILKIIYIIV